LRTATGARTEPTFKRPTLATQQQAISAAQEREQTRDRALAATLAQIAALKQKTRTPADVLRQLPTYLPLPEPLRAVPGSGQVLPKPQTSGTGTGGQGNSLEGNSGAANASPVQAGVPNPGPADIGGLLANGTNTTGGVLLPSTDLKPLFDYVQDCRACQAKLGAAQQDLADERSKEKALKGERDAAVTAAKGGGFWKRVKRNVKWFGLGTLAGGTAVAVAALR
jgi:hypothetical protein